MKQVAIYVALFLLLSISALDATVHTRESSPQIAWAQWLMYAQVPLVVTVTALGTWFYRFRLDVLILVSAACGFGARVIEAGFDPANNVDVDWNLVAFYSARPLLTVLITWSFVKMSQLIVKFFREAPDEDAR